MAIGWVLDTNVVLYLLGGRLREPLGAGPCYVSIITELELLSYPEITSAEERYIRSFLDDVSVMDLGPEICRSTINIRRTHNLKLPDAVICATALALNATLLTNDKKLAALSELSVSPVLLR